MSPPRKPDSTRAGTDRVEIILAPGQRERIADLGLSVSELARHLIDLALAELDPRAVDGDGEPVPVADRARLKPHGLVATGRTTMLARLDLADEAGLQAALASVPDGWSARTVTTGRVRVIAHPDQTWRVIDGYPDTPGRAACRPTVHITNWSSRKLYGPGRQLTIMALPRQWEHGAGRVGALTPDADDLRAVQAERITMAEYRRRFEAALPEPAALAPHRLLIDPQDDDHEGIGHHPAREVRDGDTLCCSCSRSAAAEGRCHRVWAAEALARAGWRVILDGTEVVP